MRIEERGRGMKNDVSAPKEEDDYFCLLLLSPPLSANVIRGARRRWRKQERGLESNAEYLPAAKPTGHVTVHVLLLVVVLVGGETTFSSAVLLK